jgi:predicted small lipoprotein YifL
MKRLVLTFSAMIVLTLSAWGQATPVERPSQARVAAHRGGDHNRHDRRHHRRGHRRIRRHHRRHTA